MGDYPSQQGDSPGTPGEYVEQGVLVLPETFQGFVEPASAPVHGPGQSRTEPPARDQGPVEETRCLFCFLPEDVARTATFPSSLSCRHQVLPEGFVCQKLLDRSPPLCDEVPFQPAGAVTWRARGGPPLLRVPGLSSRDWRICAGSRSVEVGAARGVSACVGVGQPGVATPGFGHSASERGSRHE